MAEFLKDEALDWDSEILEDGTGGEYAILPEGNYRFTVSNFVRGQHNGSAKIPSCPKAELTLEVEGPDGPAKCTRNLFMCKSLEKMLSDFFRCIGQKKRGEKLRMDWSKVLGSQGIAHFRPREYNGKQYNECAYFLDPDNPAGIEVNDVDTPDTW